MKEKPVQQAPLPQGYSEAFRADVERFGMESLLHGSDASGSFEEWEQGRKFLAPAFDREGSLLDYGCANGFFLRCQQEWSGADFEPYGIDVNEMRIQDARKLFASIPDHFQTGEQAAALLQEGKFPEAFDSIYWNVWDNMDFHSERGLAYLRSAYDRVKSDGRLVLGFYDAGGEPRIREKISQLLDLGYSPSRELWSPSRGEAGIILEK